MTGATLAPVRGSACGLADGAPPNPVKRGHMGEAPAARHLHRGLGESCLATAASSETVGSHRDSSDDPGDRTEAILPSVTVTGRRPRARPRLIRAVSNCEEVSRG